MILVKIASKCAKLSSIEAFSNITTTDQEEEEERSSFGYARTGCFYFQKGNRREATLEEKKRGLASFQQK